MENENEDVEVIEVSMSELEIDNVIASLRKLKIEKESVQFPIAADVDLLINYDNSIGDDDEDEDELEGGI